MKVQEKYLLRALDLAKNGLGNTFPNPLVGCVIVHQDSIIGEGFHQQVGEAHAEVNAIASVKDKTLLRESTVYVSLEPCSHFGKTPPCSDLLIRHQVKRVVIATQDPFASVSGRGIARLKQAGIDVQVGYLVEEAFELNKRFFTFHLLKRPYITLKFAHSKDGFMDVKRQVKSLDEAKPNWISNTYSRQLTHKLRAEEQAILVGKNTILNDNPSLTTRFWSGNSPMRVILDKKLELSPELQIFSKSAKTLVFYADCMDSPKQVIEGVEYVAIKTNEAPISQILEVLFERSIQGLIVEGGAKVLKEFMHLGLYDEIWRFTGAQKFEDGLPSPDIDWKSSASIPIQKDVLEIFKNPKEAGLQVFKKYIS